MSFFSSLGATLKGAITKKDGSPTGFFKVISGGINNLSHGNIDLNGLHRQPGESSQDNKNRLLSGLGGALSGFLGVAKDPVSQISSLDPLSQGYAKNTIGNTIGKYALLAFVGYAILKATKIIK